MSIKPIETHFDGYAFRSRLEARWGVFFDALGIKWEYEKEGYRLTREPFPSTDYLPDFWLPDQDCWVEIKGEEPTPQEKAKASYLALHSRKPVYIFFGSIPMPEEDETRIYKYAFPAIWLEHPEHEKIFWRMNRRGIAEIFSDTSGLEPGDLDTTDEQDSAIETQIFIQDQLSIDTLDVISGTYQMGMSISKKSGKLVLNGVSDGDRDLLTGHIYKHTDNLLQLLKEGWIVQVQQPRERDAYRWFECEECHALQIAQDDITNYVGMMCDCSCVRGIPYPRDDTPRLLAAYTAARQARFEHR